MLMTAAVCLAGVVAPSPEVGWPVYGGDQGAMKYSPLAQINRQTVVKLAVAWTWKTNERPSETGAIQPGLGSTDRVLGANPGKFEVTPLMIDGVLYLITPNSRVVALKPDTGEEIWSYAPHANEALIQFTHRGIAYWTNGTARRIFLTAHTRLIALDAGTGEPAPEFGRGGEIDVTNDMSWPVKKGDYEVTSPGVVYKDLVILGSGIPDGRVYRQDPPGDVQAFDVHTGKRRWAFHTVPQQGEFGTETWEDESWRFTGHANVWAPMALDAQRALLYLPVTQASNDFYGGHRKGDNLFANSLVCVDANTGKRVWHFQTVHHGVWDFDGVLPPTLATIHVDGKRIDVVAAVSKTGFTYVFDRVTGKPVWPIEERPVPQTDVPGERTSPTQPFPTKPPPFAKQGFTADDVVDLTPALRAEALEKLKPYRLGSLFSPPSVQGTVMLPGDSGGGNWGGSSFDPDTGLLYVKAMNWPTLSMLKKPAPGTSDADYIGHGGVLPVVAGGIPIIKPPYTTLTAIDLNRGELVWQVPFGDAPFIRANPALRGLTLPPLGGFGYAGVLVTRGGLAFVAGGDRSLHAFDKSTGKMLWESALGLAANSTPMTYQTGRGRQFLVVAAGASEDGTLFAFALPAGVASPAPR
jgi:quinoprotein glucose dehydrogenase